MAASMPANTAAVPDHVPNELVREIGIMLNPDFLAKFTTETGKIYPRRTTGVSAKVHRRITREIKRARALNLLP